VYGIFVERLWWTVKYHYLHLHSFENGLELQNGLRSWFEYYNRERTHQPLNRMTQDECDFKEQENTDGLMVRRQPGQRQSPYGLLPLARLKCLQEMDKQHNWLRAYSH
jgi:transposase InsO family protein